MQTKYIIYVMNQKSKMFLINKIGGSIIIIYFLLNYVILTYKFDNKLDS